LKMLEEVPQTQKVPQTQEEGSQTQEGIPQSQKEPQMQEEPKTEEETRKRKRKIHSLYGTRGVLVKRYNKIDILEKGKDWTAFWWLDMARSMF
jgi:hypothetical protein